MPRFVALIPAAGSGSRMGSELPKQYLPLSGRPLIEHGIRALAAYPRIDRVYVVLSPQDAWWQTADIADEKLRVLRCGGAARADSVRNGLEAIAGEVSADDWVLVHDAARPCLRAEHLDRMLAELADDEVGGILAVPLADTLKRAGLGRRIAETLPREGLWQAQTPQMFRHAVLLKALQAAGNTVTDEASAIERLGLRPKLIEGDLRNLKVTYPRDLELAALILEHWKA